MRGITQKKTNALALDLSAPISKRTAGQQDGHTNGRTDGRMEGRMEGRSYGQTDEQADCNRGRNLGLLNRVRQAAARWDPTPPGPSPSSQHAVSMQSPQDHFSSLLHGGMCCQAAVNTQLTHS